MRRGQYGHQFSSVCYGHRCARLTSAPYLLTGLRVELFDGDGTLIGHECNCVTFPGRINCTPLLPLLPSVQSSSLSCVQNSLLSGHRLLCGALPWRGEQARTGARAVGKRLKIELKPSQRHSLRPPPNSEITPRICGRVVTAHNKQRQCTTMCVVLSVLAFDRRKVPELLRIPQKIPFVGSRRPDENRWVSITFSRTLLNPAA